MKEIFNVQRATIEWGRICIGAEVPHEDHPRCRQDNATRFPQRRETIAEGILKYNPKSWDRCFS